MRIYMCALPIKKGAGVPQEFISDDTAKLEEWAKRHDQPGWGVYRCPNPLKDGATTRSKDTIAAVVSVRIDVDGKDVAETLPEVDAHLNNMLLPPTSIIDSGRGRHADWELKEPISTDDAEMVARVDAVRKRLVEILCADPAPAHQAALFREPGTHNAKEGAWTECKVLHNGGSAVDVTELEEMVALYDRPLLTPKPKTIGEATVSYLDFTTATKTTVDVEARLAAMRYQGAGDTGINCTWWTCMGSLLRHGMSVNDAIEKLHAAAEANCQNDPNKANWRSDLAGMAERWLRHEPEFVPLLDSKRYRVWQEAVAAGKQPRLIWRQDLGLQVRGLGQTPQSLSAAAADGTTGATVTPLSQPAAPTIRFKLVAFNDLRPGPEPLYLIDELIPIAGLVDIWGPPKCFKSFVTLDMMFHVATKREYRDRCVRGGAVVYCAFEGAHGYKKRIEAIRRHYEVEDDAHVPLYVMPGQANLITDHKLIIHDITAQLGGTKPAAVVLDTLNKSLHGSESKDTDMGAYVKAAEAIRDAFGCVVIIVHHCGLDETRPRGHTSLPGAVDAQLAVVREGDTVTMTVEMMRDGPEDTVVASTLEVVEVGTDESGKILTSLIVKPSDTPIGGPKRRWAPSLDVFRRALAEALLASERTIMVGAAQMRVTDLEAVRHEFYSLYVAKGDTPAQQQDNRKHRFRYCVDRAQRENVIGVRVIEGKTLVWMAAADTTYDAVQ
jgi:AAA domain